jgi:hypothetical protein
MGLQRFPLGGFKGGMNLADNPYSLKSGEAQIATDVDIGLRDVLASRKGFTGAGLAQTLGSQTKSPTNAENVVAEPGGTPWTEIGNVKASDNNYATVTGNEFLHTWYAYTSGYGFALPAGAVVVGVEAKAEVQQPGGKLTVLRMRLFGSGVDATYFWQEEGNYAVEKAVSFGNSSTLWNSKLTKAKVEGASFGCGLEASFLEFAPGTPNQTIKLDSISMTVFYITEGAGTSPDHQRPWYTGNNRNLVMSDNGLIKVLKGGETNITELFAGTAGTTWSFEQMEYNPGTGFKDSLWMVNGVDPPKKWDGTTFENWAGKPPKGTMLRVWRNRMIVAGHPQFPQRVFFSEPGDPQKPEDETNGGYGNNWIDIRTSEDDLDPITWLEVLDDVLLVFKKRSVNAIYDSTSFSFQRIANIGCEGRFQSCVLDDRAYFVNRSGVYSVTAQGAPRYESLNLEPMFKGTGPPGLEAIDLNLLATSSRMCSLPNGRVYLACTPKGEKANRWLLECYPRLRGEIEGDRTPWVKHSFAKRCIKSMCSYRSKDEEVDRVAAGLTDEAGTSPELAFLFEGLKDGLEPIDWQWITGYKSLLAEEPFERVRRLDILMKGRIRITMIVDGKEKIPPNPTKESPTEKLVRVRPEARGRYHAVKLEDTGADPPTQSFVYRGEIVLRGGKEH